MKITFFSLIIFTSIVSLRFLIHYAGFFAKWLNHEKVIFDPRTEKLRLFLNISMFYLAITFILKHEELSSVINHFYLDLVFAIICICILSTLLTWTKKFKKNTSSINIKDVMFPKNLEKKYLDVLKKWMPDAREKDLLVLMNDNSSKKSLEKIQSQLTLKVDQFGFQTLMQSLIEGGFVSESHVKKIIDLGIIIALKTDELISMETYKKAKREYKKEKEKIKEANNLRKWRADVREIIIEF